ncbi:MAG: L,D-transpeptidase family protein [Bacteroidota bacterium]
MKQPFVNLISGFRYLLFLAFALTAVSGHAQVKPKKETYAIPQNVKVLEEKKDKEGNILRTIQYFQDGKRITETLIIRNIYGLRVPINPDTMIKDSVMVVVNKSKFNVEVFYRRKKIRVYKAVFGPKPLVDKCMEGDRCTPEGSYRIRSKNPASKYYKCLLIDYPNDSSTVRFKRMKNEGKVPAAARIGGDVGIHGIWKGGDDMIEMGIGWTDGCIAIKNKDIDDLYPLVAVGTRVYIKK